MTYTPLRRIFALIGAAAMALTLAGPAAAQQAPVDYSQDELDQMLAPIALYPDDLLTQVLIASTYPLEVVEAARFVQQNPQLTGTALDEALAQKNWDPSVQSLAAFPQVLAMMSDKLEWMQRLGNAFLADDRRVMDTVQSLRQRAQATGTLQSTPQQSVLDQNGEIMIEPGRPDVVYVPVYDPTVVYGPWWAPAYPPWFWYPPPIYGYPAYFTAGIVFGIGWPIWHDHWGWAHTDWHDHHVVVHPGDNRFWNRPNHPRPPDGQPWQHAPDHRRGVAYPDPQTRDRFQALNPDPVRQRQFYRGYATPASPALRGVEQPVPGPTRPGAETRTGLAHPAPAMGQQQTSPALRQTQPAPTMPQVQSVPNTRQLQIQTVPSVRQPQIQTAPSVRQPQFVPQQAPISRSAPSIFNPGVSRQQAQINAQRGLQSRQSVTPASPAVRAPSRAPSAPAPRGR
jgi:hypothetical protein